ncbi:MAG: hypothetical protein J3R72DRAFT_438765 [Linnemannia gamsii]|nr:MAG: hypothetical protein J3R72DRAFT_438765 [Linnemannia gamsii]
MLFRLHSLFPFCSLYHSHGNNRTTTSAHCSNRYSKGNNQKSKNVVKRRRLRKMAHSLLALSCLSLTFHICVSTHLSSYQSIHISPFSPPHSLSPRTVLPGRHPALVPQLGDREKKERGWEHLFCPSPQGLSYSSFHFLMWVISFITSDKTSPNKHCTSS